MFDKPAFAGHESVHHVFDQKTGLRAIIAVHSTYRGPAAGGLGPLIGDADLHYFGEGSHLRPYTFLGAHPLAVLRGRRGDDGREGVVEQPHGGEEGQSRGQPQGAPALGEARVVEQVLQSQHAQEAVQMLQAELQKTMSDPSYTMTMGQGNQQGTSGNYGATQSQSGQMR